MGAAPRWSGSTICATARRAPRELPPRWARSRRRSRTCSCPWSARGSAMPSRSSRVRRAWVLVLAAALSSCAGQGPPAIHVGDSCAACGMTIRDLRFACESRRDGWLRYDSIECLLADRPPGIVWLADYDTRALAPAESLWIVQGDFPSPMGGGLAAFHERDAAERVAVETHGRVTRFAELTRKGRS